MFYVIWNKTEDYSWTRGIDRQYSDSSGTKKEKEKPTTYATAPTPPQKQTNKTQKTQNPHHHPVSSPDRQHNSVQNSTEEAAA